MIKKFLIALTLLTTIITTADASKSTGEAHAFAQPDGTTLMVRLLGNETRSWYQTLDGVLLKRNGKAFYIARTVSDGTLANTGILAHNLDSRTEIERTAVKAQDKSLFHKINTDTIAEAKNKKNVIAGYPSADKFCPHSGKIRVPVILMEYAETDSDNVKFEFDKETFEEYFNGTKKTPYSSATRFQGYSSVAQYFNDASYGDLQFEFDIYGPYTANKGHDYYGHHSDDGYPTGNHEFALLTEAVKKADPDIDFSQYDTNGNGYVDMVYVLYAGTGANISGDENDFWPSCWYNCSISTADGNKIKINVIGGANELTISAANYGGTPIRAGVGVTCHEMSHGLGLPDLYWTSGSTPKDAQGYVDYNNCGPEDWDVMDGGENLYNAMWPCMHTAWERDIMGWITAEELTEPCDVTIYPLNKNGGKAYRVTNPANTNEYYIIENYMYDEWNYYINARYGRGLMITHVNASSNGLSMSCNNTYGKPSVTLLPADGFVLGDYSEGETIQYRGNVVKMPSASETDSSGNYTNNWNDLYFLPEAKGDPYVATKYAGDPVTSVAAYKNYAGEDMVTKYPITDIKRNSDGSISFKFMGCASTGIADVNASNDKKSDVYTIDGRAVDNNSALPHGIYIQDGHKIMK